MLSGLVQHWNFAPDRELSGMSKIAAEALLKSVMQDSSPERKEFSSPPPWNDIYPPQGFIDAMGVALDCVQAKTIHYFGLADETILRWLCSRASTEVSTTDMASWWGTDIGDYDTPANSISRVPLDLSRVKFNHEGAPRTLQALIQDMRLSEGDFYTFQRRMMGGPHCIGCLGPAIEQCRRTDDYEWQEGAGYLIGVWKAASQSSVPSKAI